MHKRTKFLVRTLVVAMLVLIANNAFAIDKNQLIQMAKLGLDDKAIIAAIDSSSKDELKLKPEDVGELRLQGVSDKVIAHLKSAGYVGGAKKPPKDDTKKDPDGDELAPAEDIEPNTEETPEEKAERERLEKEKEAEILRKAEELNKQKSEEQFRTGKLQGLARKLPEYKQMVDRGQNMDAARNYLEFMGLNPPANSAEWYEAKFGLAKALYQQGILSGASTPLLEVLLAGSERPHFKEAFYMLERLTREIGYRPPILEELTKLYVGDTNADFQNDFNYYMGKFFFDYNRSDLAIQYLSKVTPKAKDYPEAVYVMGIAQLDPQVNDTAGALTNFQQAIVSAEDAQDENKEILELGYLALARTWYEVGLYDVALFYYQKVPRNSGRNAEATFEQAWTYTLKNDHKRALGVFQTLESPYYDQWYYPDLYILESTVYVGLCKFEKSQVALAEFQKQFLDKRPRLQKVLQTAEPIAYWEGMMNYKETQDGLPRMFYNAVLNDLGFFNIYNVVKTLQTEKAALESNIGTLGEFGQSVLDRVNEQLRTKTEEGGILVQQKLSALDKELGELEIQATKISFDIDSSEKQQIEQKLRNPGWEPAQATGGSTFFVVADDWHRWDFEGEYWLDEVTNFRSSLRTECVEQ